MEEYPKSENIPDYPHGNWIDEDRWEMTGMPEVFDYARRSQQTGFEDFETGQYAIYAFNDLGAERLIPLEYYQQEEVFTTVSGVFDSNPGKTQRQTPWEYTWKEDEIEEEVRNCMMDSKLVEVDESHIETAEIFDSGLDSTHYDVTLDRIFSSLTGMFR